jgi:hypothetical protein
MWSISTAHVELSLDVEVPYPISSTKIKTHEIVGAPHCTVGISEDERRTLE